MHSWAKGLSREVGKHGITVNCIPPGRIISEQILRNYTPEYRQWQSEHEIPVGEYGQPEDIANLVCFLASPRARYITGAVIPGGRRLEEVPVLRDDLFFSFSFVLFCETAKAQTYPVKPIRLVVPFAPGGSCRSSRARWRRRWKRASASRSSSTTRAAAAATWRCRKWRSAEPDGYTLIIGHVGSLAMNPYMYDKLPYDVDRDFAPVSLLAIVPAIFVVHEAVPAKDLREFVALAKKEPGKLYYGSAGNGSAGHLAMEYLKQATGIDIQHVPYKGTGPNVIDLVAGRTQAASAGTPPLMPHVKSGQAARDRGRRRQAPALAARRGTVAEQGYPGFETSQWYGLNAPAKTPEAIIKRLAEEAAKAAKSPQGARALRGRRRRGGRLDAGGVRGVHQEGAGALEQGRARREHQGGLISVTPVQAPESISSSAVSFSSLATAAAAAESRCGGSEYR